MSRRGEIENGMGWGALVPTRAELNNQRREREELREERQRFHALLFDLWADEVLTEQQCARYLGLDLLATRKTLDDEATRRGYKTRDLAPARGK